MLDEAWVTYSDGGYFSLMSVLIRSLREFSSRPVLVYGVRDNFNADPHPNVAHAFRVDSPEHIWTLKLDVMLDSVKHAKRCIFLDADCVANHSIDQVWSGFAEQQKRPELPLLPDHPPTKDCPVALRYERVTGEHIGRPWGCTCLIWYTADCVPCLTEARDIKLRVEKIFPDTGDGEAINAALDSHGSTSNAPFCTPYYRTAPYYLGSSRPSLEMAPGVRSVDYHLFHGCKDPSLADALLGDLIEHRRPVHYEW